jgi:restriction system protein
MASKRSDWRRQLLGSKEMVGVIAALGALYVAMNNIELVIGLLLFCGVVAFGILMHRNRARTAEKLADERIVQQTRERLAELLPRHEAALISYYHQDRTGDLFGNSDDARWQKRIETFLEMQVVPGIPNYAAWRKSEAGCEAASLVDAYTAREVARQKQATTLAWIDPFELTPIDYERYCAELLRERGWTVRETPATRDSGADFVAERDGIRLVAQCKRYSQPVGNKAVQEVNSAVRLYNGNVACVIAPSGYTRQAQREATGLSVHLLHHSALAAYAEKLTRQPITL